MASLELGCVIWQTLVLQLVLWLKFGLNFWPCRSGLDLGLYIFALVSNILRMTIIIIIIITQITYYYYTQINGWELDPIFVFFSEPLNMVDVSFLASCTLVHTSAAVL